MKVIAILSTIIGMLFLAAGILNVQYPSEDLVQDTIQRSRKIEQAFERVVEFIEDFRMRNESLPTQEEYMAWAEVQEELHYHPRFIEYHTSNFPKEAIEEFGPPKQDDYLLDLWRGDWSEYYSSWAMRSSVTFDESDYYFTGSYLLDTFSFFVAAFVLVIIPWSVVVFRSKRRSRSSGSESS